MIRSYGGPVRSDLDAATAYKVAKAYFRTMRIRESHWLLVHLQLMRICSANFKGGDITIVKRSPVRAFVGLHRFSFLTESTGVAWIQAFSGHRELCPKTIFTLSEP